jgi:hypothetical protein
MPTWLPGILVTAGLFVAISHQSFWIDETTIGVAAREPSLRDLWQVVLDAKTTELQSPFYMAYVWIFARVFGNNEWALRASNLLWLVPGLILFVQSFRIHFDRLCVAIAILGNACIWYYAGEARMYGMLLGTSGFVFAAIHQLSRDGLNGRETSRWLTVFLIGFVLQCGTTLLGAVWAIGAFLLVLLLWPRQRFLDLWRCGTWRIVATCCLLFGIAGYYFWTLRLGARATAFAKTDWRSMGFIVYEQLGFAGLGPGRTDLRVGGVALLRPYAVMLAVYALLVTTVTMSGAIELKKRFSFRRLAALCLAFVLPGVLLLTIGAAGHWRVLGRHCIVLMPGWAILAGFGLSRLWRQRNIAGKVVAVAFVFMALWSCLLIRFAFRHERDDYRDAAETARAALAHGQVVWWNAVGDGANYYHLPLTTNMSAPNKAVFTVNVTASDLAGLTSPDVVAVSKPELFDIHGAVAAFLAEHHYNPVEQFPAFTIWKR